MNYLKKILYHPHGIYMSLISRIMALMPDKTFLKWDYKRRNGFPLDLINPNSFTEKIQWLKLYDRNPIYTILVDKFAVKKYIREKGIEVNIIPTLGVYNSFDEIDFSRLPSKFVLKCTHDSGTITICRDKNSFNIAEEKKKFEKSLKRNYYKLYREWPYKNVCR